jgi:large subunit ribosomal protein L35
MPKQKTHKGLTKRIRVSKNGKVKHKRVGAGHLLSTKAPKRKRRLRRRAVMDVVESPKIKRLLGHVRP